MKSILLVEDDPFLVDIYTTKLKQTGFKVKVVTDGEDVFKVLKEESFDVVILDIVLPNVDGWEVLKRIKQDSGLKDTKVIILSNLGQKTEVEKGLKLGAIKYLIKAYYTPSEVVEEIKKVLNKK